MSDWIYHTWIYIKHNLSQEPETSSLPERMSAPPATIESYMFLWTLWAFPPPISTTMSKSDYFNRSYRTETANKYDNSTDILQISSIV